MMEMLLPMLTQFGAAGLIGLLWLMERRAAAQRERALNGAHDRLMQERQALSNVLEVVRENTRAVTALERTQAQLVRWLERRA